MYNTASQEKSKYSWENLLAAVETMLSQEKDLQRRKDLRYSVNAFKTLISQKAPYLGTKNPPSLAGCG